MRRNVLAGFSLAIGLAVTLSQGLLAKDNTPAYKVFGKEKKLDDLRQKEQDRFFQIENDKYQLVEGLAKEEYLDAFWEKMGKEKGLSPDKAREKYIEQNVKASEAEVKETLDKYKDHPKLKELAKKEQEDQIRQFLKAKGESELMQTIIENGLKNKDLVVMMPRPEEPVYKLEVTKNDVVRYGPNVTDTKPLPNGCKGDDCAITIIEYSEYQCPFCARVLPTTKELLTAHAGKIRWITRDFPLDFHPRARPAAIAAKCAGFQGRYWDMYHLLFDNQQNLSDKDFDKYAQTIADTYKSKPAGERFDKAKYDACVANPKEADAIITQNMETARKYGVTGTPAFFVNGRRMSGALPRQDFEKKIAEVASAK